MTASSPHLCLGTVQFGLPYGIAGSGARVNEAEARAILSAAWEAGIRRLDTAPGYGDIEERLISLVEGRPFSVVTKIPSLPSDLDRNGTTAFVNASLDRSQARLGDCVEGVLFHSPDSLEGEHGAAAWDAAASWCDARSIALGLSVYDPDTLNRWASGHRVQMAQLPANALDQRLANSTVSQLPIELTVRSALLQGLLLMTEDEAANRLPAAAEPLARWQALCRDRELKPASAALGIIKGLAGVHFCAIGVDTAAQLREVVTAWEGATPFAAPELAVTDQAIIDPRFWQVEA